MLGPWCQLLPWSTQKRFFFGLALPKSLLTSPACQRRQHDQNEGTDLSKPNPEGPRSPEPGYPGPSQGEKKKWQVIHKIFLPPVFVVKSADNYSELIKAYEFYSVGGLPVPNPGV